MKQPPCGQSTGAGSRRAAWLMALMGLSALLAATPAAPQPAPRTQAEAAGRVLTPGSFDAIDISGSALVRFVQGAADQVVVDGDEDAQRAVSVRVSGSTLHIHPGGAWKFWNSQRAQLTVTARELRRVSISGAADFVAEQPVQAARLSIDISGAGMARFDRLRAESLRFAVSGSGDGRFAGSTDELTISVAGRGDFRGEHLMSQKSRVSVSGVGDVQLWAVQELSVSISGVGSVDYWGTPQLRRSTSGLGSVNARGAKALPP